MFTTHDALATVLENLYRPQWTYSRTDRPDAPDTHIQETAEKVTLDIDAPGVVLEGVQVSVQDEILRIRTERKGRTVFQKSYTLTEQHDQANISAVLSNGVLTVTVPKIPRAQPRVIQVKSGS